MKKYTLSAFATIALSVSAFAGTYPANGPESYKALYDSDLTVGGPYIGVGYSYVNADVQAELIVGKENFGLDVSGDAITALFGYSFNEYIALEGRYTATFSDLAFDASGPLVDAGVDFGGDISNMAIYLKPMYSTPAVSLYGLIGYGQVKFELDGISEEISENSFQWGLGISIAGGENLQIFMDYTKLYDDSYQSVVDNITMDAGIDAFTFGLAYRF